MPERPPSHRRVDPESARRSVEAVWRIESARIVGALTRRVGDFALAEDLTQEALTDALAQWPATGVPRNPAAWLTTVAERKAIDHWRRRERYDDRMAGFAHDLEASQRDAANDMPWDPDVDPDDPDDVLRLIFVACHPVLPREARVALTLRVVCGLTTDAIGKAFLVPTTTVQQRIVRAKKTLGAAQVRFEMPAGREYARRVGSVLNVVYLLFSEGHSASSGDSWMRTDLSLEALRLGRVLTARLPRVAEAHALSALMELTAARFPARLDADGKPILLADQDRRLWDRGRIARGRAALARADELEDSRGPYAVQAAIAECHALASSVDTTDWHRIVDLYDELGRVSPSPVVELNRAAAIAMADGPESALRIVDELAASGRLARYRLLPATRAELLLQIGRTDEARAELAAAAQLTENERERAVLLDKISTLERPSPGST
ncbi:DUF6596 domain-containing protein [Rhodococcus sp. HNM0569]|uniref:DUF6596 domain-containing protein n=1 Tax=Rhodococcus sp. HNM0569 TaxID=2716340 RepID=UPI00146A0036|nr:RNA polymerase subunit sigma-24 [Rhodococcus sp. HNM0569]